MIQFCAHESFSKASFFVCIVKRTEYRFSCRSVREGTRARFKLCVETRAEQS